MNIIQKLLDYFLGKIMAAQQPAPPVLPNPATQVETLLETFYAGMPPEEQLATFQLIFPKRTPEQVAALVQAIDLALGLAAPAPVVPAAVVPPEAGK